MLSKREYIGWSITSGSMAFFSTGMDEFQMPSMRTKYPKLYSLGASPYERYLVASATEYNNEIEIDQIARVFVLSLSKATSTGIVEIIK